MALRSAWAVVETDYTNKIFVIEDISNHTGGTTITNDAENVLRYVFDHFDRSWRTVYKDTDNEWWEIYMQADGLWKSDFKVGFKRWHGLAWDILQRKT